MGVTRPCRKLLHDKIMQVVLSSHSMHTGNGMLCFMSALQRKQGCLKTSHCASKNSSDTSITPGQIVAAHWQALIRLHI